MPWSCFCAETQARRACFRQIAAQDLAFRAEVGRSSCERLRVRLRSPWHRTTSPPSAADAPLVGGPAVARNNSMRSCRTGRPGCADDGVAPRRTAAPVQRLTLGSAPASARVFTAAIAEPAAVRRPTRPDGAQLRNATSESEYTRLQDLSLQQGRAGQGRSAYARRFSVFIPWSSRVRFWRK